MQWMTTRKKTDLIVLHHTANGRSTDMDAAYDRLVDEGRSRLESYSIVILLDWKAKKAPIKNMPWPRSSVTNHAFGCSLHSIGISIDANFENDPWEDWIENELVYLIVTLFDAKDEDGYLWPDLEVRNILAHRECVKFDKRNATACNGKNFYGAMRTIIKRVEAETKKRGCYR